MKQAQLGLKRCVQRGAVWRAIGAWGARCVEAVDGFQQQSFEGGHVGAVQQQAKA
ncbi:hypothetical protein ACERK3_14400 [Phycisphaerales bacterium AB-hyl4]|uniref:Uncharacterized protein n=1 Tax=Natronomicrosphaera hydrolytica TaxID=3242702 RepID=A0ABV4U796_9BACT